MIHIEYDPINGGAVRDGTAEDLIDRMIAEHKSGTYTSLTTGTFLVIEYLRLRIAEGAVSHEDVQLEFAGTKFYLNQYGNPVDIHWPDGMLDTNEVVFRILSAQTKLRRKNKNGSV